ncbi:hypothetical protein EDB85DRAFT_1951206 [Lactarius pseudohatsudake]|nr:hypothetical protein EDB85DRAFT_1951206 [Lactarius pseudohatsudake]
MPNDVEKEVERARRQRVREEERRRENERRLEGQRWEFERKCEALRRKKAAADEENGAALAKYGRDEVLGGACENRVGEGDKPQPHRDEAPWSNDQGRRSGKLKRKARAKGETDAETKTPAGRASLAPAKKEHPGLHVIAQAGYVPTSHDETDRRYPSIRAGDAARTAQAANHTVWRVIFTLGEKRDLPSRRRLPDEHGSRLSIRPPITMYPIGSRRFCPAAGSGRERTDT